MPDEAERRIHNGEILSELQGLRRIGTENHTALIEVKKTVDVMLLDLTRHLTQAEQNPNLIAKINDLWDFRNKALGAIAILSLLSAGNLVITVTTTLRH
jgi:hypothetical protein